LRIVQFFRVNNSAPALSNVQIKGIVNIISKTLLVSLMTILLAAIGCSKADKADSTAQQKPESTAQEKPDTAPKSDLAALQKSWRGEEQGQPAGQTNSLVLSGNNLEFHANSQEWYKGTFTLHEDTNPKQMIVTITDCPAPQYVGKIANAIYRIENGTLIIAGNEPGNPVVPASFDAPGTRLLKFDAQ
jgi:uncharacterized protein (TIGR03067 family)